MWSEWLRSPSRVPSPSTRASNFSCSSFKDIQTLCQEDSESERRPKKSSIFHRVRIATSALRAWASPPSEPSIHGGKGSKPIVVYFTSLRVVRKTFEDCRTVRSILKSFRVPMDERDLSMDSGFLSELQGILGRKNVTLPRVFIGGRYVGGADEIRWLHETGELTKLIQGLVPVAPDAGFCDACGGHGFVLCDQCSGSHKVYSEKRNEFRSCTACNENGLIRCPSCSIAHRPIRS